MLIPKNKPIRNKAHLKFIASLPCCVSCAYGVQSAHIRKGNNSGMGFKSGDDCTVPLSLREHNLQHQIGCEEKYWKPYGGYERATKLAKDLFRVSGNREAALELIIGFQNEIRDLR